MKYILLFLFSISTNAFAEACNVEFFDKILKISKESNLQIKDIIKSTDCSHADLINVSKFISNVNGVISSDIIKNEAFNNAVNISPNRIEVNNFEDIAKEKINLETNYYLTNNRSLNHLTAIGYSIGENLEFFCDQCSKTGDKNIKIDVVNTVSNFKKSHWINSKIQVSVKALKAVKNISFQQLNLESEDFVIDEILTDRPEDLITDLTHITFFRANRMIMKNSHLNRLDVLPINLVNYGTPVKAILNKNNILLEQKLMPLRSARFNETIELSGPNNKKLYGKVTNFNQVEIEL